VGETFLIVRAVVILLVVVGGLGASAIALVRWARRTGRRPWLWLLGTYAGLTLLWALLQPLVTGGR
jgi:hypothetical protein